SSFLDGDAFRADAVAGPAACRTAPPRRAVTRMYSSMPLGNRAKQFILLIATIVIYDELCGDQAADVRGGGGPAPALHACRRGAPPRAVRAVAPRPAA